MGCAVSKLEAEEGGKFNTTHSDKHSCSFSSETKQLIDDGGHDDDSPDNVTTPKRNNIGLLRVHALELMRMKRGGSEEKKEKEGGFWRKRLVKEKDQCKAEEVALALKEKGEESVVVIEDHDHNELLSDDGYSMIYPGGSPSFREYCVPGISVLSRSSTSSSIEVNGDGSMDTKSEKEPTLHTVMGSETETGKKERRGKGFMNVLYRNRSRKGGVRSFLNIAWRSPPPSHDRSQQLVGKSAAS